MNNTFYVLFEAPINWDLKDCKFDFLPCGEKNIGLRFFDLEIQAISFAVSIIPEWILEDLIDWTSNNQYIHSFQDQYIDYIRVMQFDYSYNYLYHSSDKNLALDKARDMWTEIKKLYPEIPTQIGSVPFNEDLNQELNRLIKKNPDHSIRVHNPLQVVKK